MIIKRLVDISEHPKIFLKRPVSEKLGLSRYQKKIDQHLDNFNKEVSIIIISKKVNSPQLPLNKSTLNTKTS